MSTLSVDTIQGKTTAGTVKLPSGSVLQTIFENASTSTTINSTSYIDANVTATITPKYSTSKILVLSSLTFDNASNDKVGAKLLRDSTTIKTEAWWAFGQGLGASDAVAYTVARESHYYLDSPATTSATVYKWQVARLTGSSNNYINYDSGGDQSDSQIILMEIAQ